MRRPLLALALTAAAVVAQAQSTLIVPNLLIKDVETGNWIVSGGPELPTGGASRITVGARFLRYADGWYEWNGSAWTGSQEHVSLVKGDAAVSVRDHDTVISSSFPSGKNIDPAASVLWYGHVSNSATHPQVWALNPLAIKQDSSDPDNIVVAIEASVSNNTSEADDVAGGSRSVIGVWSAYGHVANQGSAAFASNSLGNATVGYVDATRGWKNGLFVDGISTGGTGIRLEDANSNNGGMLRGVDLSGVNSFTDGAIVLGHAARGRIRWLDSDGTNGANILVSTDTFVFRSAASETVVWQNQAGTLTGMQLGTGAVAADSTALLLLTDHGGVEALRQVSVGAADSCGVGFRCLRVPN